MITHARENVVIAVAKPQSPVLRPGRCLVCRRELATFDVWMWDVGREFWIYVGRYFNGSSCIKIGVLERVIGPF